MWLVDVVDFSQLILCYSDELALMVKISILRLSKERDLREKEIKILVLNNSY